MLLTAISQSELDQLGQLSRHYNVAPIFFPNEASGKPESPVGRLFVELTTRVLKQLCSLTPSERDVVVNEIPPSYRFMFEDKKESDSAAFLRAAADYYVLHHASPIHFDIHHAIFPEKHNNLVLAHYPELTDSFDKDGLLILDDRFDVRLSGVRYRDHVFHYHQFLRRGFSSSTNMDLIDALRSISLKTGCKLRIALDITRLMPVDAYRDIFERDYWWGPKYDEEKLDAPSFTGMAVVKRREGTILERLLGPIDRTEFFWFQKTDIKTLEIEEICRADGQMQGYGLNRYVHAERDTTSREFRHLDGAVKVYSPDEHSNRLLTKLSDRPKALRKPKLFRVDGHIPTQAAMELIGLFYRSNEMIMEYFDPAQFVALFSHLNVPWTEAS